jgi:hypothetical protein
MGERTRWKMRGLEFKWIALCVQEGQTSSDLVGPAERIPDSEERRKQLGSLFKGQRTDSLSHQPSIVLGSSTLSDAT